MNRDIALYLGGQKVDWTKTPDILLTYERTDYTNPTVTKNMFSKTLTIEGTPNNNNIFNHIWNLERVMDENFTLFNPALRVSFELYNNAEIVETGYAKLDSINRNGYKIAYNITLYGGLGSFFYNLAYDINTDKEKTLADLNFLGTSNPDDEFDFEINKNTVYNAWDALKHYGHNTGAYKKYDCINFIPCYNGIPDSFDANRVLLNLHGITGTKVRYTNDNSIITDNLPTYISDGETTYGSINGYLTGEMMRDCDEWEMRDLRSYLQRPCLSVKGMFDAICDPQNNGGFNVVLDNDFFSSGNPYYSKAFMTLPMLNPESEGVDEYIDWDWYKSDQFIYTGDGTKEVKWKLASVNQIIGTPDIFTMDVEIHITVTGTTADKLYTSSLNNNSYDPEDEEPFPQLYYYGCTAFQMYGFGDGYPWYTRPAKCGSNLIVLTSKLNGQYIGTQSINTWWGDRPYSDSEIQYNFGYWKKVSGSDYVWHNETDNTDTVTITMESNLMSDIPNIGLAFSNIMTQGGALVMAKCGYAFDSQYYDYYLPMNEGSFKYWNTIEFNDIDSDIVYKTSGKMRSYKPVTKKDLLGGLEGTPCDWLLSYSKLFGLFIEKDKVDNTIYIKLRNNWYENEIVDLDSLIDRSKEMKVSPLTFESKWYNFQYGEAEGKFLDRYHTTYSQPFGKQRIDTKYNFDADEIDLLEDTKFRNGLTALEKSNYFNNKVDVNGNRIPQCLFDWCTMKYYNGLESYETNMALPMVNTMTVLNPNTPDEFYDVIPKLQLKNNENGSVDGDGVLVFFNGLKPTGDADYWISDDVDEMFIDSDNPCWLQTQNEWNAKWTERIAIRTTTLPEFNRYLTFNNLITSTWDYGYTKELYVPYYRYDIDRTPTMYENFWKSYIVDLYSVNTRKVDCNVNLDSNDIYGFMKKFYWWDNSIWVCTKVSDFDICLDKSTLCSFTKVNNMDSYLEMPTFNDKFFNFYRTNGQYNIPAQGTDEERSVYFNLDCSSHWNVYDDGIGYAQFDPNYPTEGNFGMGYTIKSIFTPNYSQAPRYCLYIADNNEGEQRMIRIWQKGYEKEKVLTVDPSFILVPKEMLSTVEVTVTSSSDWSCTNSNWTVLSSTSGASGVTTITVSATTNNTGSQRVATIPFTNEDGVTTNLTIKQKATDAVTLEQNEPFGAVYTVPASGGNVHYMITADVECQIMPMGETEDFTYLSGNSIEYYNTIQPTSGTNFWIHFDHNQSTVTRNASFYAYYVDSQSGRHSIFPTVVQLPLQQLADGNTEVSFQSNSDTGATALGVSGLSWTATTNNSWIHLITTTGSNIDTSVEYTVDQNEGRYRTGYIYITYKDEMGYFCNETIVIHQEGVTPVNVNPTAITVDWKGGDYMVTVTSPTSYTETIGDEWIDSQFNTTDRFAIHIGQNDGYSRTSTIQVATNGQTYNVVVNQSSRHSDDDYTLDYEPKNILFEASGGTVDITIKSDSNWSITQE